MIGGSSFSPAANATAAACTLTAATPDPGRIPLVSIATMRVVTSRRSDSISIMRARADLAAEAHSADFLNGKAMAFSLIRIMGRPNFQKQRELLKIRYITEKLG